MYEQSRRGQALSEWAIVIAIVSIACIVGLGLISGGLGPVFSNVTSSVAGIVGGGNGSGNGNGNGGGNGTGHGVDANGVLSIPFGIPPTRPVANTVLLYADYLPSTSTVIPTMTSPFTPSGIASDSSHYVDPSAAWMAMGVEGSHGWLNDGSAPPAWIGYQFPSPVKITAYAFRPWWADNYPGRTPRSWIFQGSTDGTTWVNLDSQTAWDPLNSTDYVSFAIGIPGSYAYYRMYITANHGDTYTGLGGLRMFATGTVVGLFMMTPDGVIHQVP